ncbi:MAG: TrbG/VirB9 family P-type conjugative transfer protein [Candidatus Omnitrophica bacterium]|nr:TrbG/VirB9 family P-type conjugative transfer protein [Candidatus Omnitrophota bacterium]
MKRIILGLSFLLICEVVYAETTVNHGFMVDQFMANSTQAKVVPVAFLNDDVKFEDVIVETKPIKMKLDNGAYIRAPENEIEKDAQVDTIVTPDNVVKFPYGMAQPKLICGKLRACVIELAEGEEILDASPGDTERWSYKISYQVSNEGSRPIITVKPFFGNNMETNLVIVTNKRIYDIQLKSIDEGEYTPRISFYYPQPNVGVVKAESDAKDDIHSSSLKVEQMNFDYKVQGDKRLPWFPAMVFDDGRKVYIKMSDKVKNMELPVFVAVTAKGAKDMVNYRYREPFFIVDKLFNDGELILNADKQKIVKIFRKTYER